MRYGRNKQIITEKRFTLDGLEYIAQEYADRNTKYEIVLAEHEKFMQRNMKDIACRFLVPYKIGIPTDANECNTSNAL